MQLTHKIARQFTARGRVEWRNELEGKLEKFTSHIDGSHSRRIPFSHCIRQPLVSRLYDLYNPDRYGDKVPASWYMRHPSYIVHRALGMRLVHKNKRIAMGEEFRKLDAELYELYNFAEREYGRLKTGNSEGELDSRRIEAFCSLVDACQTAFSLQMLNRRKVPSALLSADDLAGMAKKKFGIDEVKKAGLFSGAANPRLLDLLLTNLADWIVPFDRANKPIMASIMPSKQSPNTLHLYFIGELPAEESPQWKAMVVAAKLMDAQLGTQRPFGNSTIITLAFPQFMDGTQHGIGK